MISIWHAARFWFPIIVSVLAAGFSGAQWYETREMKLMLLTPSLGFFIQTDDTEPIVGIQVYNSGPGPTIIKEVTYYVDLKSVRDSEEAIDYGRLDQNLIQTQDFVPDDTMAV